MNNNNYRLKLRPEVISPLIQEKLISVLAMWYFVAIRTWLMMKLGRQEGVSGKDLMVNGQKEQNHERGDYEDEGHARRIPRGLHSQNLFCCDVFYLLTLGTRT